MSQQTITIRPWVKKGGMLVNATALDIDDPDHIYNQIVDQGGIPEEHGYQNPLSEQYKDFTRGQLLREIHSLTKEIEAMHRVSVMWR